MNLDRKRRSGDLEAPRLKRQCLGGMGIPSDAMRLVCDFLPLQSIHQLRMADSICAVDTKEIFQKRIALLEPFFNIFQDYSRGRIAASALTPTEFETNPIPLLLLESDESIQRVNKCITVLKMQGEIGTRYLNLDRVAVLFCMHQTFDVFPASLFSFTMIEHLFLSSSKLKEVPIDILSRFPKLNSLNISGCPALQSMAPTLLSCIDAKLRRNPRFVFCIEPRSQLHLSLLSSVSKENYPHLNTYLEKFWHS